MDYERINAGGANKLANIDRACALVDLGAITNNIRLINEMTPPKTKVMAVVKANGYGHGTEHAAKAALSGGAAMLGVAALSEGVALRKAGLDAPILAFGTSHAGNAAEMLENNIIQTVHTYEGAELISETAALKGKTAEVHIKLDTGMGRVGFAAKEESIPGILKIKELKNLRVTGIYSHFADSDEDRGYTLMQLDRYRNTVEALEAGGMSFETKHISNSAAILNFREADFDMVRPGILTYGLPPCDAERVQGLGFRPALTLLARVNQVKEIAKGESVSYNRLFIAQRKTTVATLSIGYADGYARILANKGIVLVNGKRAPAIGRICMDYMMLDVTDAGPVKAGDLAVLIGRGGDDEITAGEVGARYGSNNYDVVTLIRERVPRVYTS